MLPLVHLHPIAADGSTPTWLGPLPGATPELLAATAARYAAGGCPPLPWRGYVVEVRRALVGTCGFQSAPVAGEVELVYGTFVDEQGRGYATAMVRELVALARAADPSLRLTATTAAVEGPAARIMRRHGFRRRAESMVSADGATWRWVR